MSRRSGHRFADKDMRQRVNREHIPVPQERDVPYADSRRTTRWRARSIAMNAFTASERSDLR